MTLDDLAQLTINVDRDRCDGKISASECLRLMADVNAELDRNRWTWDALTAAIVKRTRAEASSAAASPQLPLFAT